MKTRLTTTLIISSVSSFSFAHDQEELFYLCKVQNDEYSLQVYSQYTEELKNSGIPPYHHDVHNIEVRFFSTATGEYVDTKVGHPWVGSEENSNVYIMETMRQSGLIKWKNINLSRGHVFWRVVQNFTNNSITVYGTNSRDPKDRFYLNWTLIGTCNY